MTPEEVATDRILNACWNYLGTCDPAEIEEHLAQYVLLCRRPTQTAAPHTFTLGTPCG